MSAGAPLFTKDNAASFGRRGGIAKGEKAKARREQIESELAKQANLTPDVALELEIVEEGISQARKDLKQTWFYCEHCKREGMAPNHRAQLMKALDSFLDRRRILLNRPLPGTMRPTSKPTRTPPVAAPEPEAS